MGKLINYLIAMGVLVAFFLVLLTALISAPVFAAAGSEVDFNSFASFALVFVSLFMASVLRKRISFKNLRNLSLDTREYIRGMLPPHTPRLIGFFEWDKENGYRLFEYIVIDPYFKGQDYERLYKETVAFLHSRGIKTRIKTFEINSHFIDENNKIDRDSIYYLMFQNLVYINYIDHTQFEEEIAKYKVLAVSLFTPPGEPPMVIPLRDIHEDGFIPVGY